MRLLLCAALAAALLTGQEEKLPSQRSGKYEVSLRLPPEGLYPGEEVQIEFRVVDASQVDPVMGPTPIIRAKTRSEISMPAMPGMPRMVQTAHVEGIPGEYGVHPSFPHGGEYKLELTVQPPGDREFSVQFPLRVADAPPKNRKAQPKPWLLDLRSTPKNPRAGEPAELVLSVRHKDTPKQPHTEFDIQHEKLIHLLVVRSDLASFAHEHPELQTDGTFTMRYAFPRGGEYHLFADVAPRGAGSQVLLGKIKVSGDVGDKYNASAQEPAGDALTSKLQVNLQEPAGEQPARKTVPLSFTVLDRETKQPAMNLEPYLGAMGHLILVHSDGITLVHSHPDELSDESAKTGSIRFLARFPKAGIYRGWLQLKREGVIETGSLIFRANDAASETVR